MSSRPSHWSDSLDHELRNGLPRAPRLNAANDVVAFRQVVEQNRSVLSGRPELVDTTDTEIGPRGVRVRTYVPEQIEHISPVVYLHAGGFVAGSIASADAWVRRLTAEIGAVVTAVDYSLAPEYPYPAAIDDVASVVRSLSDRSGSAVTVVGDSAGAGLGAGVALRERDDKTNRVGFLSMTNPALDDRLATWSATNYVDTPLWTRASAQGSWNHYLGPSLEPGSAEVPKYAAPAREVDLSYMPSTFVMVSHLDPLRDEAIAFAQRLLAAEVSTELHMFPGTFHGSRTKDQAEVSQSMIRLNVRAIRRALNDLPPA